MTGKEWIENVTETLQNKAERLSAENERLETLRAEVITMSAIVYDSDKVQTSCIGDKLAQKYSLMDEISRKMLREMEEYNIFRASSIKRLHKYIQNPTLAYILEARHIDFKSNEQIISVENITERGLRKRFNKAYDLLNSIYILEKYRKYSEKVDSSPQDVVV